MCSVQATVPAVMGTNSPVMAVIVFSSTHPPTVKASEYVQRFYFVTILFWRYCTVVDKAVHKKDRTSKLKSMRTVLHCSKHEQNVP